VSKTGVGAWELTGLNTYSGGTQIEGGVLELGSDTSYGTGPITFAGGAVETTSDIAGQIRNSAQAIVMFDSNATFSHAIDSTNTGGMNLINSNVTLNGNNTYTGGTTISGGLVTINGSVTGDVALGVSTTFNYSTSRGGQLAVNGSVAGDVSVAQYSNLGGHGTIGGTISGAGSVGPGNSARNITYYDGVISALPSQGILTAAAVDPSEGMTYNFQLTQAGAPTWTDTAVSGNDVLALTGDGAFTSALTSANDINVYFSQIGTTYDGGFFSTGATDNLSANVADATYTYYLLDNTNGTFFYNGNEYDLVTGQLTASTL
jgi:autotransporter-associated beta strand protein